MVKSDDMEIKNMRSLLIAFFLIMLAMPALAQDALMPGERGEAEIVAIYGSEFTVKPYRMSLGVHLSWQDAKAILPAELFVAPEQEMSAEESYQMFWRFYREKLQEYEAAVVVLAAEYMKQHPGEFDHMDGAEREIAGRLHDSSYKDIAPEAQDLHDMITAMMYLNEMLGETLYGLDIKY